MNEQQKESLIRAAQAGGKVLKEYFNKTLNPKEKTTPADMQTEADIGSEQAILEILKIEFPGYNINSEESGNSNILCRSWTGCIFEWKNNKGKQSYRNQ